MFCCLGPAPRGPRAKSAASRQTGASIAQMVERKTLNLVVVGSIPTGGAPFWPLQAPPLRRGADAAAYGTNSSRFSSVGRASD